MLKKSKIHVIDFIRIDRKNVIEYSLLEYIKLFMRNFLGNSRKHFISSVYLSKNIFGVYEIDILFTTAIFKVKSRSNPLRNSKNIRKKIENIFGKNVKNHLLTVLDVVDTI